MRNSFSGTKEFLTSLIITAYGSTIYTQPAQYDHAYNTGKLLK